MRARQAFGLLAVVVMALLLAASAAARVSTYTGQFFCDDRGVITPLAGMNVELWERGSPDFLPVELVGHATDRGFTDSEGRFSLRTEDNNDKYFVRMALRDAHGVHLRDFWGINDWSVDTGEMRNDVAVRDYGGLLFRTAGESHKCAIWSGVHKANERYRAEIGSDPPSGGVELEADAVTAGVPFTPGTSILWPGGFPVGYGGGGDDSITRHEYGHVIRHGFDGNLLHFFADVATYNYLQNHEVCNHTNGGFAFNEGWAEFWAEDFSPAPDCGRPGDMETEGNVAAALTELMENCGGGQRKPLVETLRSHPGTIHSFDQFRAAFGCPVPKLFPVTALVLGPPPPSLPSISPAARAEIARGATKAGSKLIRSLGKQLTVAVKKADDPPPCKKAPCKAALKTLTRPATIKLDLKLARIQRSGSAPFDSAKEQSKLAGKDVQSLLKSQSKRQAKQRKKIVRVEIGAIKEILKAGRPVFKSDSSRFAKVVRRKLNQAAKRFRKALKKASKVLPSSLFLQPPSFRFPRRAPKVPTPTPPRVPTVGVRTVTKTAFTDCPAQVVEPKAIEVAGTLGPAPAGSAVRVTFTSPSVGPTVVVATTDAAGKWSASHKPAAEDNGNWAVDATYAGDSTHAASSAPTCSTSYVHP